MNYQVMPPLSEEEYSELKSDIEKRGVMVPIEFDEDGNVLDGHHRLQICEELGITVYPKIIRNGMTEEEKRTHARRLNMARRQLNREQKQQLIREQLMETPERSDRQIAAGLGVSDKTVGSQRKEMEGRAEIPHITETTDTLGRIQPRTRQMPKPEPMQTTVERKKPEINISSQEFMDACVSKLNETGGYVSLDDVAADLITSRLQRGEYAKPNGSDGFDIFTKGGVCIERIQAEEMNMRETPVSEAANDAVKKPHVVNNSTDNEWYTPEKYIELAREVMGSIDLDPASNDFANETVKANRYYTEEEDGLKQEWFGNIWMNPPYSTALLQRFAEKLTESKFKQAIVLVNNATETAWFEMLVSKASAIVFHKGRIRFVKRDGEHGSPLQGQAFIYYGDNADKFLDVFGEYGWGAKL